MPIQLKLVPRDTRQALHAVPLRDFSRSLYFDRYAAPTLEKDDRKGFFTDGFATNTSGVRLENGQHFFNVESQHILYAQLQSRLLLNMAGGVMENAGLCLDRFGLPYIPGSAVKGCARRMAIQSLLEKREGGAKTDELSQLLANIALVFGWGEQDWSDRKKDDRFMSDFAFAIGGDAWPEVCPAAKQLLPECTNFAGSVSFLPAHPVDAAGAELTLRPPPVGTLELDIVTCHHPDYYKGIRSVATDDEDPNPVVFPAVAAGHVFAFTFLPLRNCTSALQDHARRWLADGLALVGLGAKTAAGYGWFDTSSAVNNSVAEVNASRAMAAATKRQKEAKEAAEKTRMMVECKKKEEAKAAMAALSPEQQEDFKIAEMTDDQFRSALDNFARRNPDEQKAITRALRFEPGASASRRPFWDDLKTKTQRKGGKYALTEQAIRQLCKQMYSGKEGKMP